MRDSEMSPIQVSRHVLLMRLLSHACSSNHQSCLVEDLQHFPTSSPSNCMWRWCFDLTASRNNSQEKAVACAIHSISVAGVHPVLNGSISCLLDLFFACANSCHSCLFNTSEFDIDKGNTLTFTYPPSANFDQRRVNDSGRCVAATHQM